MRTKEQEQDHVDVMIVPFVDVFIFLLIAFIAGTILERITNTLEINLPVVEHAQKSTTPEDMVIISIAPSGRTATSDGYVYYWGTEAIGRNALETRLIAAGEKDPEQRIRIDCDQAIPFKAVSYVVDRCVFRGLHNVGLRMRDATGPQ